CVVASVLFLLNWTPTPRPDTAASAAAGGFTVQFGALRSQQMAMDMARQITVDGAPPRVVATVRAGVTIFRVVIGPFATRAEAERVARTSGRSYWIYEGAP
ncbi:MAG: SPOR domain-containing protein, partial [Gemmatimonadaceae bacterium]|nr:SPOR domain-containing protein [Gemmatimonadaceae bacterium]